MNEADEEPLRDQLGLAVDHEVKERSVRVSRVSGRRIVPRDDMIGEMPDAVDVPAGGKELEGADADMARGDAGQHGARQRHVTPDRLSGCDDGEGSGRGDAESGHRLADDVLAQDRAEGGSAVAVAGEWGGAGALELDVAARAIDIDNLSEKNGAAVAELRHEGAELVAGIGHREGFAELWHRIPRRKSRRLPARRALGIEPKVSGELVVQPDEAGRGDGGGRQARKEPLRQPRVAVVERERRALLRMVRAFHLRRVTPGAGQIAKIDNSEGTQVSKWGEGQCRSAP